MQEVVKTILFPEGGKWSKYTVTAVFDEGTLIRGYFTFYKSEEEIDGDTIEIYPHLLKDMIDYYLSL